MGRNLKALIVSLLLTSPAIAQDGIASVYWEGAKLATGERFYPERVLCAHKTLPLRSFIRVTVAATGRSIECQVLDRGPYINGRIVDLSLGAARALGVNGLARVTVQPIK